MNTQYQGTEHLPEDDLARLLDSEGDAGERAAWRGHLDECGACTLRLEELGEISHWLHENVSALDLELAPNDLARRRTLAAIRTHSASRAANGNSRSVAFGIAATIAILLVGSLSVTPLRAWISEHVERLTGQFETAPSADLPEGPIEAAGALVTFTPTQATFRLELGSPQATGSVTIELAEVEQATAQVVGGTDERLGVLPAGLWIENAAESTASYRVNLPAGFIRAIEISASGEVIARRTVGAAPEMIIVDLATYRPTP